MAKRGQFFIIATLVIVYLILGVTQVYISVDANTQDRAVYDLTNELSQELTYAVQEQTFNPESVSGDSLEEKVTSLVEDYVGANPDKTFVIFYGNTSTLYSINYPQNCSGNSSSSCEEGTITPTLVGNADASGIVTVLLDNGETKEFNLRKGENFYIIVQKESGGESYVGEA